MWSMIQDLVDSAKNALGLELPDLPQMPADLGSVAEGLGTAAEAGTGAVTEAVAGVSESASGAVEAGSQVVNDTVTEAGKLWPPS
jgi:hypothetical protein